MWFNGRMMPFQGVDGGSIPLTRSVQVKCSYPHSFMNVNLNDLSVTGVGVSAFDRIGLEDMLPRYNILVIQDAQWVKNFPGLSSRIHILSKVDPNCPSEASANTNALLEKGNWTKIQEVLGVKNLLIYKPIRGQEEFMKRTGICVLANSYSLAQKLENKCEFRRLFGDIVPLPEYELRTFEDLKEVGYEYFQGKFGEYVVQDSTLSGGRGTFFVKDEGEYEDCLRVLAKHGSKEVVVSRFVFGDSSSVQVCVTKYGVFSLPPQRQVISQSALVDTTRPMTDKFNGGQWVGDDFSLEVQGQIKECAISLGGRMGELGYKGIFGIDFISTSDDKVFIIEVNARITGMTPIITGIQKSLGQTPFLLLHTLEHLGAEYTLSSEEIERIHQYSWGDGSFGYMILFNLEDKPFTLGETLKPGVYKLRGDVLEFVRLGYKISDLASVDEFLLVDVKEKGSLVAANKRMGRIITPVPVIGRDGELLSSSIRIVESVRRALA